MDLDTSAKPVLDSPEIRLINEITEGINRGNSMQEVFDLIYERLAEHVPYNRIAIALADAAGERLTILAARSDGQMVLGRGYSGQIAGSSLEPLLREGKSRVLNDLQGYLERKPGSESTRLIVREGMRSSLTLPLISQGTPVGVMFFSSRRAGAYTPVHEAFLRSIVGHVSIAVEKSRLLDELRETGDLLGNILGNSADAIIAADRRSRILTWNEGARRIYGYAADEVRGRETSILLPGGGADDPQCARLQEHVEREEFVKGLECTHVTKDGRRIRVNVTATLLKDRGGRPIGHSLIVRDVTDLEKLQQELARTQSLAAVGQLAATVAHEVKNPLAGISGAIQVLRDSMKADDSRRGVVREILEQIDRLDRTVRDLLGYARPANAVRQDLDLGETLKRSWSLLAQQPGAGRVTFRLKGAEGVRVSADAQLLQQVWINLFQNSIEAMPEGGELSVKVTDGNPVRIVVTDSGNGVRPAEAERLFQPFFSTKTRGTGLGLAISRKNVEAHGGRMWIESDPDRKTSVFVEVPR